MGRARGWLPVLIGIAGLGFALGVAGAKADGERVEGAPYRAGPVEARRAAPSAFEWPGPAEEILVLGGIGAILYGFRASGLSRERSSGGAAARRSSVR